MFTLHSPDTVEADWENRDLQILREQADAGLKFRHFTGGGIVDFAFGEDEDAVAAVDGFGREAEAFAEAGELRKRENVEERGGEPVAELIGPAPGEEPVLRRAAQFAKSFSAHGGGEVMAEARRERGEDEANIGATRDVIGDDEE